MGVYLSARDSHDGKGAIATGAAPEFRSRMINVNSLSFSTVQDLTS